MGKKISWIRLRPTTQHPTILNVPARAAGGQKEKWERRDITEIPSQDIFVKGRKEWSRKGGRQRAEIEGQSSVSHRANGDSTGGH